MTGALPAVNKIHPQFRCTSLSRVVVGHPAEDFNDRRLGRPCTRSTRSSDVLRCQGCSSVILQTEDDVAQLRTPILTDLQLGSVPNIQLISIVLLRRASCGSRATWRSSGPLCTP